MKNIRLDHATINTTDVAASIAFYGHFLNLRPGWRPPLSTNGAWLYPEDQDYALVHLIDGDGSRGSGTFDHVAFRGVGLAAYLDKVRAGGGWFEAMPVPETPFTQVHHIDPNGIKIEVIFKETLATGAGSDAAAPVSGD